MMTILPLSSRDSSAMPEEDRKSVRLEMTRRGRVVVVLAAFLLGVALTVAALILLTPGAFAGAPDSTTEVTVEEGDTLWAIAEEHAPAGSDVSDYVAAVQRLNAMPTPRVTEGQVIELPSQG